MKKSFSDYLNPKELLMSYDDGLWGIKLIFETFDYEGDGDIAAHLGLEQIDLGVDSFEQLAGREFSWDEDFLDGAKASFFTRDHDSLKSLKFKFGKHNEGKIAVEFEAVAEFLGIFGEEDADDNLKIEGKVIAIEKQLPRLVLK